MERRAGAAPFNWGACAVLSPAQGRTLPVRQGAFPALHVPRREGEGKRGKGDARRPKMQVTGRRSVGYGLFDK
jgi:hypothetical protein